MGYIIDFLINWGYWGMLVSAFLAGSFFPFSSEVVMSGLQAAGLDPIPLVIYGSIGNVLGSLFNYGVGRLGKMEWIEKYLHVKKEKLDQAERFMADRGAWMGFFAFIPILGSAITIVLGLTRANIIISTISITIGKVLGSLFNYGVGRLGKMEWIEKYLHVKKEKLDQAERFMAGRGAWMGFFAFIPILGSAITIVLGLTRANIIISTISITIGKVLRYVLLVYGLSFIV